MKKTFTLLFLWILALTCVTACGSENKEDDIDIGKTEATEMSEVLDTNLVNNPTEEYVISCLEVIPNVTEIAPVTVDNDPNGGLSKDGGYYSAVYFAVDLINQEDIYGDNLIEKATDAGGCIESYRTVENAQERDEQLAEYDDSRLFNTGYHTVVGNVVVRTSKELSEREHVLLENNIVDMLISGEIDETIALISPDPEDNSDSNFEQEEKEESAKASGKIVMPKSASEYIGSEWTIETITEHFNELGFTNINSVPCEPNDDRYDINIFEMVIETGLFSTDPWNAGDKFKSDAEITIYYNELPMLTIDNCPDLVTVLTSQSITYMDFCNKYDGRYVEFDAYVSNHSIYDGGTSHVISVVGGNYDGQTVSPAGLVIHIGDRTWGNSIDKSVEVGDYVTIRGRIDASWAEYYTCLYVETRELRRI